METAKLHVLKGWKRLLVIALLPVLLPTPTFAIASSHDAPAVQREMDDDALGQQAIDREIDRFRTSTISLRQAMSIAESLHPGSTTADVSFDGAAAASVYRVKTLQNDRIWHQVVDATTGEIVDGGAALPLTQLDADDRGNLAALRAVRHRLADAVRVAERAASGKAISGGLVRERGRLNFSIIVVSGNGLKEVILQPPTARGP
jgi:uncharacterized membrane protein YkoI